MTRVKDCETCKYYEREIGNANETCSGCCAWDKGDAVAPTLEDRYTSIDMTNDLFNEDLPTETNEYGGNQSKLPTRFDLIPSKALVHVAAVLAEGAEKYGEWNWTMIPTDDHLNHAIHHLYRFLYYRELEDLTHAACRVLFAISMYLLDK